MFYSVPFTEYIERMFSVVLYFLRKGKFRAVVRLNNFRSIPEKRDSTLNEVDRAVRVLFPIGINKPFARGFVDYPVLIESVYMANISSSYRKTRFSLKTCKALPDYGYTRN